MSLNEEFVLVHSRSMVRLKRQHSKPRALVEWAQAFSGDQRLVGRIIWGCWLRVYPGDPARKPPGSLFRRQPHQPRRPNIAQAVPPLHPLQRLGLGFSEAGRCEQGGGQPCVGLSTQRSASCPSVPSPYQTPVEAAAPKAFGALRCPGIGCFKHSQRAARGYQRGDATIGALATVGRHPQSGLRLP